MEEFERRVTLAHRAASVTELRALLSDLPGGPALFEAMVRVDASAPDTALAVAPQGSTALVPASQVRPQQKLSAIFGGIQRAGNWTVARRLKVRTIFGGAQLDFRNARFGAGETTLEVTSVLGGVEIIVPPELAVEVVGNAIFGGFEHLERAPVEPDPNRPVLRVTGIAVLGGVSVRTLLDGESDGQARRRDRHERRAERRLERAERRALRGRD